MANHYCLNLWILVFCVLNIPAIRSDDSCKKGCPASDNGKFLYKPGNVYTYNLDSSITIAVTGSDADETNLRILGQANIYADAECLYTLKLERLAINLNKEKTPKKFTQDIDKPVQFTFVNGEIEPQICAHPKDSDVSLNIKRAIISLLQSSEKPNEIDVFGTCPTTTTKTNNGNIDIYTKIRNLNKCGYRENLSNGLISSVINEKAGIKSTQLLSGDYSLEQKVKNGIIENIELIEEYKFIPFSTTNAGAKAKVKTHLNLSKTNQGTPPNKFQGRSQSIIFKNPRPIPTNNLENVKNVLVKTINEIKDYTGPNAAQNFAELIRLLRLTDADKLKELLQQVKSGTVHENKELARKVYLDALYRTGTGSSVEAVASILGANILDKTEQKLAYLSFNLVDTMTKEALTAINTLLDTNPPEEAYLSVGNLVNKYCKQENCENSDIRQISEKLVNKLGDCKSKTRQQQDTIINILKGIRNTQRLANSAIDKLIQCSNEKLSNRVRVYALQAFTAASCNKKIQNTLFGILKNRNEDSEIRIEAYLAMVTCPNADVANNIATILKTETVNQVGTFITTHLKTLRDSTEPSREIAKIHFNNIRLNNKFPIDPRRYSFNHEISYAFESLGIGASADYSLIYSQNGFLPRSTRLNLTGEIFGNNFNMFDLYARQENLETILEYYFGPKGFFKQNSQDIINKLASSLNNRKTRSIRDDVNNLSKKIKPYGNSLTNDINLDYSLKMFGNEFFFLSLGDNIPSSSDDFTNIISDSFEKLLNGAKNFEHDCHAHTLLLDNELVYPTGIGFPLELIAQSSGIGKFQIKTNIDIDKIVKNWKKTELNIKLLPSGNIIVNGLLKIDAFVVSTGLSVKMSAHSSVGSDLKFKITDDGNGFDIDINLPFKKQELIHFNHDIEFITQERGKETAIIPFKSKKRTQPTDHCFDQLSMFGLTACFTAWFSENEQGTAPFPLNGHSKLSLWIETESKIKINGLYKKQQNQELWELNYDTPGSSRQHTTNIKVELGISPNIYARTSFKHPEKFLAIEGGLTKDKNEYALYAKYEIDKEISLAKLGFTKVGDGPKHELKPLVYVKSRDRIVDNLVGYKAEGKILVEVDGPKRKYNFDNLRLISPGNKPITINGQFEMEQLSFNTNLKISDDKTVYDFDGKFNYNPGNVLVSGTLQNKDNKHLNGHFSNDLHYEEGLYKNKMALAFGQGLKQRYEMENSYETDKTKKLYAKLKNVFRATAINGILKLNGEYKENSISYDIEAGAKGAKLGSTMNLRQNLKSLGDYELDLTGLVNKYNLQLKSKRLINGKDSTLDNSLTTSWGTKATLKGQFTNKFSLNDCHIDLQGTLVPAENAKKFSGAFTFDGTPKTTKNSLKIQQETDDIVVCNMKLNRNEDLSGNFDIKIKNVIDGNGEMTNKVGTGTAWVILNFVSLDKKAKLDTKYTIKSPNLDVKATLYYDYEKDDTKKVTYTTTNILQSKNFETKNVLEILTEKYTFDANGNHNSEQDNQNSNGKFKFVLPNGRQFGGELDHKTVKKDEKLNGGLTISLHDTHPNNKKRSLTYETKYDNIDIKNKLFDIQNKLTYKDLDNRDINIAGNFKHLPKGKFKMIESTLATHGSYIEHPININFNVDEYCREHAIYHLTGKYGSEFDGGINGNYYIGDRAKPTKYEIQAKLNAPKSQFKNLIYKSNGELLQPQIENGLFEVKFDISQQFGDDLSKFNANAKGNNNHGTWNIGYKLPNQDPGKLDGTYFQQINDENKKFKYSFEYEYNAAKNVKANLNLELADKSFSLQNQITSSFEKLKNIDLTLKAVKTNDYSSEISTVLNYNGEKYLLNNVFVLSDSQSIVDLTATYKDKTTNIYGSIERLGEHKGNIKLNLKNLGELQLTSSAEVNLESFDNFYIKADIDSKKLKLNQIHIEAKSKDLSNSKTVELKVTSNNENVLSGNAEYSVKHEKGKSIIEGQGNVQLYDKSRNANFKLVRQTYDTLRDLETGFSYSFNGIFGVKNIVSELKMTNKNFNIKLASCEEKKQCTNFEIRSVLSADKTELYNLQHKLMILIDLRELGYPHEFELQSKTTRNGFNFEHELEINIISNNDNKYQFQVYLKPTKSGILLKLPKRETLIESTYLMPKKFYGRYEASIVLFMDKINKPDEKTQLLAGLTLNRVDDTIINGHGEMKFINPLIKTLSITGSIDLNSKQNLATSKFEFDIFKKSSQKLIITSQYQNHDNSGNGFNITTETKIKSIDFGIDLTANGHSALSIDKKKFSTAAYLTSTSNDIQLGSYISGNQNQFELILTAFNDEILHTNGDYDLAKNLANFIIKMKFLGIEPIELNTKLNGLTELTFYLKRDKFVNIDAKLNAGKEIALIMNGNGKELLNAKAQLDAVNFLSSEYKVNDENVEEFLKNTKNQIEQDAKTVTQQIDARFKKGLETLKKQFEEIKNSAVDISKLGNNIGKHASDILDELATDPALHDIIEFYRKAYDAFTKLLSTLSSSVLRIYESLYQILTDTFKKLSIIFQENILPAFQEIVKSLVAVFNEIYAETVKVVSVVIERSLKALKVFEEDYNKLAKSFSEVFKGFSVSVNKLVELIRQEFSELLKNVNEYIKSLPGLDEIKEKLKNMLGNWDELKQLIGVLNDMLIQIQEFLPTEESKQFIEKLHQYLSAKLSNTELNDINELKALYFSFINGIRSLLLRLNAIDSSNNKFFLPLPLTFEILKQIPTWTTFKFSGFNYIKNEKLSLFYDLINYPSLSNLLPPFELRGHIIDGEHIITFDGRHMTFPGTCSYILAQDYYNNNFTIVAGLNNGKLTSITLIDKDDFVEINDKGLVKLNNQPTEYPIHENEGSHGMHAWRRYYSVSMLTTYGAYVICTLDLKVCHIRINGFYTSHIRGLLGNGNSEQYDDFTLPNGKITDNYADFGNSYGLQKTCTPVTYDDHSKHDKQTICTEMFDTNSNLMLGYLFINPLPYREACDHAVMKSNNKNDAACNIALAYASAARYDNIPVTVPYKCLKCQLKDNNKEYNIGEEYNTKIPQKKSDIIIVVDTSIKQLLTELTQNLINDLRGQLKSRDITDNKIIIIGYDKQQKYPNLFTTNGQLDFTGKLGQLTTSGPKYENITDLGNEKLNQLLKKLELERTRDIYSSDYAAFNLAMSYPFRSDASKIIIAIRTDSLEYSNPLKTASAFVSNTIAEHKGLQLHLIGPVSDVQLPGKGGQQLNPVGFNNKVVILTSDAKKKANLGSTDFRNNLKYTANMGVDFVLEDGGFVFPLQNYMDLKTPKDKKQFVLTVANTLADQISRTEIEYKCLCDVAYGLYAEESCRAENVDLVPAQKRTAAARG